MKSEKNLSVSTESELNEGITWRSALALVFASLFMLPITLYMSLVAGVSLGSTAVYIIAIFFTELASTFGSKINKHELYVIYMMAGTAALNVPFLDLVFRGYFLSSPITRMFIDPFTKLPLPEIVPSWWAPPYNSNIWRQRTFLSSEWLLPVVITYLQGVVFLITQEIALTFICAQLYIEEEKLPFPLASIDYEMITTLSERRPDKLRIFMATATIGITYGIIVYSLPMVVPSVQRIIPVPWLDLTTGPYAIESILPGAALGLSTDLLPYLGGFLIPLSTVASITIGSVSIWLFGNWITRTYLAQLFPLWTSEWMQGMNLALVYERSYLNVWISPFIGFGIAFAAISLIKHHQSLIRTFRNLIRLSSNPDLLRKRGLLPLKYLIALFLFGTIGSNLVLYMLLPDFPIWISLLLSLVAGPIYALMAARSVGETGYSISIPYLWQGAVLLSGYSGVQAWFVYPAFSGVSSYPVAGGTSASAGWTQAIKVAYDTGTKPLSFFKAYGIAILCYSIFSLLFVSFFWSMSPIPSSTYPYTLIQWPIQALTLGTWYSRNIAIQPQIIGGSFAVIVVLGIVSEFLLRFTSIPFSLVGFLAGTSTLPAYSIPLLIGALMSKFVFQRFIGKEWWEKYRAVIVAGLACGEGLAIGLACALLMIGKTVWIKPF